MNEADGSPAIDKKDKSQRAYGNSQLFTVRLWMEEIDEQRREFRGQVKHVVTGVTRGFREWADLEAFLLGTFDDYEEGTHGKADGR